MRSGVRHGHLFLTYIRKHIEEAKGKTKRKIKENERVTS